MADNFTNTNSTFGASYTNSSNVNSTIGDDDERDFAVKIEHLTKIYKIYKKPWYRILHAFYKKIPYKKFYAMNDVSLTIPQGEALGIIGKNGNGKSTILKLITGVTKMTSGTIETKGRIVAMLELTSGFDSELTGRENVYMKGRTIGLTREEINSRMDAICDFADIGDYIDQPIRTYSSGMKSRLGFAVSVNLEPDILIVDEVLAVGDVSFKLKCLNKMEEFRKQGKTILFVSHDMATIKAFCTSCIWIKDGKLEDQGPTGPVVQEYQDYLRAERKAENIRRKKIDQDLLLTKDDMLHPTKARICDRDGVVKEIFKDEDIYVYANYDVKVPTEYLSLSLTIFDNSGQEIFASDRQAEQYALENSVGQHKLRLKIHRPALLPGHYSMTCSIWNTQSGFVRSILNKQSFEIQSDMFYGNGLVKIGCGVDSQ